jgi:hypothetical protein
MIITITSASNDAGEKSWQGELTKNQPHRGDMIAKKQTHRSETFVTNANHQNDVLIAN